jgi:hypothetical protein
MMARCCRVSLYYDVLANIEQLKQHVAADVACAALAACVLKRAVLKSSKQPHAR